MFKPNTVICNYKSWQQQGIKEILVYFLSLAKISEQINPGAFVLSPQENFYDQIASQRSDRHRRVDYRSQKMRKGLIMTTV